MFSHCFKYSVLQILRNKTLMFWTVFFPMILATFFYFAFSNIYKNEIVFDSTKIAVVASEDANLRTVLDSLKSDDKPLFLITYTEKEDALELLKSGDVEAVIFDGTPLTMTVKSGSSIGKTIAKNFIDKYNAHVTIITDIAQKDPQKIEDVMDAISSEINVSELKTYTEGNLDPFVTFFYNLMAMAALFTAMQGMYISILNQANLSTQGARISTSPVSKGASYSAWLLATIIIQYIGLTIATCYILFILKIDFNVSFGIVCLINLVGVLVGVTFGFFIGSFGRMSENGKNGLLTGIIMALCTLSGLMTPSIKIALDGIIPWFSKISPSALIVDSFYCINIYGIGDRFQYSIVALIIWSVIFTVGGILLNRKKTFKSI